MIYGKERPLGGLEFTLISKEPPPDKILEDLEDEVLEDLAHEGLRSNRQRVQQRLNAKFRGWVSNKR